MGSTPSLLTPLRYFKHYASRCLSSSKREADAHKKFCERCKKDILSDFVSAFGKFFHSDCFRCAVCDSLLEGPHFYTAPISSFPYSFDDSVSAPLFDSSAVLSGSSVTTEAHNPTTPLSHANVLSLTPAYCEDCFHKYISRTNVCSVCGERVHNLGKAYVSDYHLYHELCFRCSTCRCSLAFVAEVSSAHSVKIIFYKRRAQRSARLQSGPEYPELWQSPEWDGVNDEKTPTNVLPSLPLVLLFCSSCSHTSSATDNLSAGVTSSASTSVELNELLIEHERVCTGQEHMQTIFSRPPKRLKSEHPTVLCKKGSKREPDHSSQDACVPTNSLLTAVLTPSCDSEILSTGKRSREPAVSDILPDSHDS